MQICCMDVEGALVLPSRSVHDSVKVGQRGGESGPTKLSTHNPTRLHHIKNVMMDQTNRDASPKFHCVSRHGAALVELPALRFALVSIITSFFVNVFVMIMD